eukprot:9076430-Pyramimonas_sp.AAC.1
MGEADAWDRRGLDHPLQSDLPNTPLQSAGLHSSTSRRPNTGATGTGYRTLFVCFERRQHGRLPPEDGATWRNAAYAG